MKLDEEALMFHEKHKGKIETHSKVLVDDYHDLSLAYSPGVAAPCRSIARDPAMVDCYTNRGNTVAVVTDGSAVLGLGNIGPKAALPVMEGKAILFKKFAGIDAVPICLDTRDPDDIISVVKAIAPGFSGINLEDISSPRCFEIERRLDAELSIPVFHDDQHGTAVVVLAALINSLRLVRKSLKKCRIVINGPGAAGTAIAKLLLDVGARDMLVCDEKGVLNRSRREIKDAHKRWLSQNTNLTDFSGALQDALINADVFIGVSVGGIVTRDMISAMNKDAIVFAMANPEPEIGYDEAKEGGASIIGTGRSDLPNQINNVLVFPGLFRGVINAHVPSITTDINIVTARAIADTVNASELSRDHILPSLFDQHLEENIVSAIVGAVR